MSVYAGVPLSLPTPEAVTWVAAHLPPREVHRPIWAERARPVRLGSLYWPHGASQWAEGWYLASDDQLAEIERQVYANGEYAPADMVLGNGKVRTKLWMLTPRPVAGAPGENRLWLLPLVDDRYWWWLKTTDNLTTAAGTTWPALLTILAGKLGIKISSDPIQPAYLKSSASISGIYEPVPPLLDRVTNAIGMRVVRGLDGKVKLQSPASAKTSVAGELLKVRPVAAGGQFRLQPGARDDLPTHVPRQVRVTFPRRVSGAPVRDKAEIIMSLSDLAVAGLGRRVNDETFTIHSSAVAVYSNQTTFTNRTELTALAKQTARDWYGWRLIGHDYCFDGVVDWQPEGASQIEWHHTEGDCHTRVMTQQFPDTFQPAVEQSSTTGGTAGTPISLYSTWVTHQQVTETNLTTTTSWTNSTLTITNSSTTTTGGSTAFTSSSTSFTGGTVTFTNTAVTFTNTTVNFTNTTFVNVSINFTSSTTWAISTGVTWTLNGPGVLLVNAPFEICNAQRWCHHSFPSWSTNQNNLAQPDPPKSVYRIIASTPVDLTGIVPAAPGQVIALVNDGVNTITMRHNSTSSTSDNRFDLPGLASLPLGTSDGCILWNKPGANRWVVLGDTQRGGGASGLTVEEVDGTPSYTGITTLRVDQGDGFVLSQPAAGIARLDFTNPGVTVEEVDGTPTYSGITTIRFDQADGFSLTNPSAGVVRVDFTGGSGVTVQAADGTPSYSSITTIEFDELAGFTITQPTSGSARLGLTHPSGESSLGSQQNVTSSWADVSGVSVTLPSAGTYLIIYEMVGQMEVSSVGSGTMSIEGRIYNDSTSSALTDTNRFVVDVNETNLVFSNQVTCVKRITFAGAHTLKLQTQYAGDGTVTSAIVRSGLTHLNYVLLSNS